MCIRTSEQSLSHPCREYDFFATENTWKPADVEAILKDRVT